MRNERRITLFCLSLFGWLLGLVPTANAWDPFRSESRDVRRGNEHLQKGQHAEALEAYETAATKLPKESGVQLNRGLALFASDKPDAAREAFKLATQGNASKEVRAQAYYDLGLTFLKQADDSAKTDKLEQAQSQLREAVDAFKSSLRNGPKNRDAAWNLELAKRRLVEVDKKQEEKKQEEQKKKEEDEKKKQEEQNEDQQNQDQQNQDQQKPDEPKNEGDKQEEPNKPEQEQNKDGSPKDPKPNEPEQQPAPEPQEAQDSGEKPLPKPMQQALDSLANGEENLEKLRARMRAARQPRRVQKDW